MNIARRSLLAAIPLSLVLTGVAVAAGSWEGTWAGAWGGKEPTSVTIAGGKVGSYQYQGASFPVSKSNVTPKKIVYSSDEGVTVTLTRTGEKTANAALHSDQGDATAELTRQ
jgi:hypothetical protein